MAHVQVGTPMDRTVVKRKNELWRQIKRHRLYYLFIIPAVIHFFVFSYYTDYGLIVAFKDFKMSKGILGSPWADPLFKYFIDFFTYFDFANIMRNTIVIALLKIVFGFPVPIILALAINELPFAKTKKLIQTVSYLPNFVSWVVVVALIQQFFSLDGMINNIRESFGLERIFYLNDGGLFYPLVYFSHVWKNVGIGSIIYLAAFSSIDQALYESADIDGANRLQKIIHITLPEIIPTATFLFIMSLSGILSAGFDQIYLLQTPGNLQYSQVLDTYTFYAGIKSGQFAYATAVGFFQGVVSLILMLLTNKLAKKVAGFSMF